MSSKPGSRFGWHARAIVGALLAILLLPYAVAPLYRFVDPVSTLMLWRWARGLRVERAAVALDKIAPVLPLSVIVAEDARYCRHWGVDFAGLREVIAESEDLDDLRGGSTIAQQTAKNLFLWPGRSYVRKALELPLALWLDFVLGKRRVMEIYLNVAEWGPNGDFGVAAASRRAFRKVPANLTASEAALLAASLPNPRLRDAAKPGPGLRRLAGIYRARSGKGGDLDDCLRPG